MSIAKPFHHCQYAHCESGVLSALLTHNGLPMSEPMAFGLTASLSFVFFPIVKISNMPLIAYREMPKNMVKKLPRLLNLDMVKKTYADPLVANQDLTDLLADGRLVGLQTSVYYLPYFPADMRFHFNAHNLLVCEKKASDYLISDPVFETPQWCNEAALTKARFAKGIFAPKGFLYYLQTAPQPVNYPPLLKKAIVKNAKKMLTPFPYAGVRGMQKLAKKIASFDAKSPRQETINYLTHIVRMQEEIGTGGGGFRYLYAAFLAEAKNHGLDASILDDAAELLIQSGDLLRQFALLCVQQCKHFERLDGQAIATLLQDAAQCEKAAFLRLKQLK